MCSRILSARSIAWIAMRRMPPGDPSGPAAPYSVKGSLPPGHGGRVRSLQSKEPIMTRALVRRTAVLVLASLLFAPWLPAAEAWPTRGLREISANPWSLLTRLWFFLAPVSLKEGCSLDPSGSPRCTASQPQGEEGCSLDPDGACMQSSQPTEAGCSLDPDGACVQSTPTTDAGCSLDPSGAFLKVD